MMWDKSQFKKMDPYDWFCGQGSHIWSTSTRYTSRSWTQRLSDLCVFTHSRCIWWCCPAAEGIWSSAASQPPADPSAVTCGSEDWPHTPDKQHRVSTHSYDPWMIWESTDACVTCMRCVKRGSLRCLFLMSSSAGLCWLHRWDTCSSNWSPASPSSYNTHILRDAYASWTKAFVLKK